MKLEEGKVSVEGGNIYYRLLRPDLPVHKQRSPLVLLHGGPGFTHDYLEPFAALANERPVLFYDQLGSGRSDRPTREELFDKLWIPERFVRELNTLTEQLELPRFHLHGHSWGSMLALDYYLAHRSKLVSLTFASPALSITHWQNDAYRLMQRLPEQSAKVLRSEDQTAPGYHVALAAYYRRFVTDFDQKPPPLARSEQASSPVVYRYMWGPNEPLVTGSLKDHDNTQHLKQVSCPTLFVCGRHDEATPETLAVLQAKTPLSTIAVFEHSAHHPQLSQTSEYLSVNRSFLNRAEDQKTASIGMRSRIKKLVREKFYRRQ